MQKFKCPECGNEELKSNFSMAALTNPNGPTVQTCPTCSTRLKQVIRNKNLFYILLFQNLLIAVGLLYFLDFVVELPSFVKKILAVAVFMEFIGILIWNQVANTEWVKFDRSSQ